MPFFTLFTTTTNFFFAPIAQAINVSPRGVNVSTSTATTVFLTFLGLNNQAPAEAFWCGAINPNQSCVPGTIFGRLPLRSNLSRPSGNNNFTDIMTIPPSVARRAYQDAARGNSSEFFYVRRFVSTTGGADEFVAVTCRLAGGGARVPLALTNVELRFAGDKPTPAVVTGETLPQFNATISYNGTGRLKGRWEVVLPGDPPPSQRDLLTEASLPVEERPRQRRYSQLQRFDVFLPPVGKTILPGPDPRNLPKGSSGLHMILLRVEATDDREGNSDTGVGIVNSGAVAGFTLPVLRYFVTPSPTKLQLLQPVPGNILSVKEVLRFVWQEFAGATAYKLEVQQGEKSLLSAILPPDKTSYTAPPWLKENLQQPLRWQVTALKADGSVLVESTVSEFQIQP
ncbi:hypothetical protein IJ00_04910 [Calothrix sp. 336/3]|nr:hypothetical protein IJ00_04910 [Calothrix sp. 336/3]